MEQFLDQTKIDQLLAAQEKISKAESAKEKIQQMYMYTLGYPTLEHMNTLSSINIVIADISGSISKDSEYYPSFIMLRDSYFNMIR